jgi:hypothetical protein
VIDGESMIQQQSCPGSQLQSNYRH